MKGNLKPRLIVPRGHTGWVTSAHWSPDSQLLLTFGNDLLLKFWDREGRLLDNYACEGDTLTAFFVDNSNVLIRKKSGSNNPYSLWNFKKRETTVLPIEHPWRPRAYSKDCTKIALLDLSAKKDLPDTANDEVVAKIGLLNTANGKIAMVFEQVFPSNILMLNFSENEKEILVGLASGDFIRIDISTGNGIPIPNSPLENPNEILPIHGGQKVFMWGKKNEEPVGFVFDLDSAQVIEVDLDYFGFSGATYKVSADGSRLFTAFSKHNFIVSIDLSSSPMPKTIVALEHNYRYGVFSNDCTRLVDYGMTSEDKNAWVYEVQSGKILNNLLGNVHLIQKAMVRANGTTLFALTGDIKIRSASDKVRVFELTNELPTQNFEGQSFMDVTPDGRTIICGGRDDTLKSNYSNGIHIWETGSKNRIWKKLEQGLEDQGIVDQGLNVRDIAISPDGKTAAVVAGLLDRGAPSKIYLFDMAEDSQESEPWKTFLFDDVLAVSFSRDSEKLFLLRNLGMDDGSCFASMWDIRTKEEEIPVFNHKKLIDARFSSESPPARLLTASEDGKVIYWDANTGKEIRSFETAEKQQPQEKYLESVSFSNGDSWVITGHHEGGFKLWDVETGQELARFNGHSQGEELDKSAVSFMSMRGQTTVLSTTGDHGICFWNLEKKEPSLLGTLYFMGENDWAVVTPSGVFDASPGAMKIMYYVVGLEVVELDQLKERYWQPGLLSIMLNFVDGELMDVKDFTSVKMYPSVSQMIIDNNQFTVWLEARTGGIGKTSLYVGPCEVAEDINPSKKSKFTIDLSKYNNYYADGVNAISIRVHNEEGWLKSQAHVVEYKFKSDKNRRTQQALHAIFVGTSKYKKSSLSLAYPDQDASYLSEAFDIVGKKLFDGGVHIKLLTTKKNSANTSSKANIQKAFMELATRAQPQDVLLIYFSGHGANYGTGEKGQFYYLTSEVTSSDLDDDEVRKTRTISSEELTDWINKIPARKQVLIFDTCHSGKFLEGLKSKSALDTTRERALERMKDRTGTYVLAGSSADKVSYEASLYGHGLLTYTLLQGMKGFFVKWEPKDGKPTVDVSLLLSSTRERVPDLAADLKVTQVPVLRVPQHGESFAIGISDKEEQAQIKMVSPVPIFVRSEFMNADTYFDDIDLSETVDQHIAEAYSKGRGARALFVSIKRFPDSYTVRGVYKEIAGSGYEVKGKIYKDNMDTDCMGDFQIKGKGLEDIVPRIGFEIERLVLDKDDLTPREKEELVAKTLSDLSDLETETDSPLVGYNELFLGVSIPFPVLRKAQKMDRAPLLKNSNAFVLDYQYYSVVQSKSRRFPYFAACNLNGTEFVQCERNGSFIKDNRIKDEHQWGDELYQYKYKEDGKEIIDKKDKRTGKTKQVEVDVSFRFTQFLDRGHMTKREDTQWAEGAKSDPKNPNAALAERGARLTFFFTNAVPQVGRFNRGAWKKLEDIIMEEAANRKEDDDAKYKVSIFTGPVLDKKDPTISIEIDGKKVQVQIPVLFWKVVYFKHGDQLFSVGFVMGQQDLFKGTYKELTGLEAKGAGPEFILKDTEIEAAQVSVAYIEKLTRMKFHPAIDPHKDKKTATPLIFQMQPVPKDIAAEGNSKPKYAIQGLQLGF